MADWLTLLLALGATARLTRLAVIDDAGVVLRIPIAWAARLALGEQRGEWFARSLLGCPFCIGFWLALGVGATWGVWSDERWWQVTALAFTTSYVSGHLVNTLDDDLED